MANRLLRVGAFALLMLAGRAEAQVYTSASGVVVFEAEGFASNITRGAQTWTLQNTTGPFSGAGYITALPNSGSNINAGVTTTSPEVQYPINFTTANPYFIWTRGYALGCTDDSIHVGLDGALPNSGTNLILSPVSNALAWSATAYVCRNIQTPSPSRPRRWAGTITRAKAGRT